jgi:nicotinamidase-related amidase
MPAPVQGLYPWPFDGRWSPADTALIVIDMQIDFCAPGGWLDARGVDLAPLRKPIEPLRRLLSAMRAAGYPILHTREGHRPDLSDLPENKRWRSAQDGGEIGAEGPLVRYLVRGEACHDIIPELYPEPGETVIDKPGKGAFWATDLDLILDRRGIRNLVVTGVTTDCCVQSTLRDANDRGYECLLLEDCCAAAKEENHRAQVEMLKLVGGHYGSVATSEALLAALTANAEPEHV